MDAPNRDTPNSASVLPPRAVPHRSIALALFGGLMFAGARQLEQDKLDLTFQQRARLRLFALKEGVANAIDSLRASNALFSSQPQVTREQFQRYTAQLLQRAPYLQAMSYLRVVGQAERAATEAELGRVVPGLVLTEMRAGRPVPASVRPSYRVIDYIEPQADNLAALGLDTAYPAFNAAARQRAYDSGQPQASALTRLAQGAAPRLGVVIAMPVYRYGAPLADVAARRAAVVGETAIVLRPADLVRKIYANTGLLTRGG